MQDSFKTKVKRTAQILIAFQSGSADLTMKLMQVANLVLQVLPKLYLSFEILQTEPFMQDFCNYTQDVSSKASQIIGQTKEVKNYLMPHQMTSFPQLICHLLLVKWLTNVYYFFLYLCHYLYIRYHLRFFQLLPHQMAARLSEKQHFSIRIFFWQINVRLAGGD